MRLFFLHLLTDILRIIWRKTIKIILIRFLPTRKPHCWKKMFPISKWPLSHLGESLTQIKLYSPDGTLLVDVDDEYTLTGGMMNRQGMFGMRNKGQVVVDQYPIENDGIVLGVINITRTSSAENSYISKMFKASLVRNSILSIVIAIFISVIIGYFISKKMSLVLKETADLARDIQVGEIRIPKPTTIKEVVSIRESLDHLNSRLKLKQKSRKALIDQLIHQSRTPL